MHGLAISSGIIGYSYPVFHSTGVEIARDEGVKFWKWVFNIEYFFVNGKDLGLNIQRELSLMDDVGGSCRRISETYNFGHGIGLP